MKKEYIKPDCMAQAIAAMNFLLASQDQAEGDKPSVWNAAPERKLF